MGLMKKLNEDELQHGSLAFSIAFQSESSLSFDVISAGDNLGRGAQTGWIDIHFPCEGHIKLNVRGALPSASFEKEELDKLIQRLLYVLRLPSETTWEASFCRCDDPTYLAQCEDKDGNSDRFVSTKLYDRPE